MSDEERESVAEQLRDIKHSIGDLTDRSIRVEDKVDGVKLEISGDHTNGYRGIAAQTRENTDAIRRLMEERESGRGWWSDVWKFVLIGAISLVLGGELTASFIGWKQMSRSPENQMIAPATEGK